LGCNQRQLCELQRSGRPAGVEIKLTQRVDLRLEPFEFFHLSNGYFPASNPGMDEIGWKYGLRYHLGKQGQER
jgi:hypothetical protein